jgi:hypothetical protein
MVYGVDAGAGPNPIVCLTSDLRAIADKPANVLDDGLAREGNSSNPGWPRERRIGVRGTAQRREDEGNDEVVNQYI